MSNYLNTPLSKRLAAFRRNNCQSLGGGWHDDTKRWHWVPQGFSTTPDFGGRFEVGGYNCRWCENVSGHFRECGDADRIIRLRHRGWFVDNFQDSTTRGMVLQLPARKGKTLYLAACSDPWNKNCAIIEMYFYDEKEDAARAADGLAERYAENSREGDLEQLAETEIASLENSIKETRQQIRALLAGIRQSTVAGVVCNQLSLDIISLRREVRQKLARIEKIKADPSVLIPR
ncbi:MAG TPA: hypothetical protein VGY56_02410 [Verrucomicrobiae bacterium]|nr:hypothetical protein [Verrucomicrobiae bacterium]